MIGQVLLRFEFLFLKGEKKEQGVKEKRKGCERMNGGNMRKNEVGRREERRRKN